VAREYFAAPRASDGASLRSRELAVSRVSGDALAAPHARSMPERAKAGLLECLPRLRAVIALDRRERSSPKPRAGQGARIFPRHCSKANCGRRGDERGKPGRDVVFAVDCCIITKPALAGDTHGASSCAGRRCRIDYARHETNRCATLPISGSVSSPTN